MLLVDFFGGGGGEWKINEKFPPDSHFLKNNNKNENLFEIFSTYTLPSPLPLLKKSLPIRDAHRISELKRERDMFVFYFREKYSIYQNFLEIWFLDDKTIIRKILCFIFFWIFREIIYLLEDGIFQKIQQLFHQLKPFFIVEKSCLL